VPAPRVPRSPSTSRRARRRRRSSTSASPRRASTPRLPTSRPVRRAGLVRRGRAHPAPALARPATPQRAGRRRRDRAAHRRRERKGAGRDHRARKVDRDRHLGQLRRVGRRCRRAPRRGAAAGGEGPRPGGAHVGGRCGTRRHAAHGRQPPEGLGGMGHRLLAQRQGASDLSNLFPPSRHRISEWVACPEPGLALSRSRSSAPAAWRHRPTHVPGGLAWRPGRAVHWSQNNGRCSRPSGVPASP
jgi:hypothetical protein